MQQLPGEFKEQIISLAISTRNARSNGAPYHNLLLYGPPGTGKVGALCFFVLALCCVVSLTTPCDTCTDYGGNSTCSCKWIGLCGYEWG